MGCEWEEQPPLVACKDHFFVLGKSLKLSKEAHNAPKSFHGFMCINDKAIVLSASTLYTVHCAKEVIKTKPSPAAFSYLGSQPLCFIRIFGQTQMLKSL